MAELIQIAQERQQDVQARPPPIRLTKGTNVILLRQKPTSKAFFPAQGPYIVKKLIGTSGLIIQHPETKKIYRVSRRFIRPFHVRKEGGMTVMEEPKERNADIEEEPEMEETEEEIMEANQKEDEKELAQLEPKPNHENGKVNESNIKKRKNKATISGDLKRLRGHNERTPVVRFDVEDGNFAIVKQDTSARLGKIVETEEGTIKLHWYGTISDKELPRKRWKWYPGSESNEGEILFNEKADIALRPALCDILRADIILTFPRLTISNTLPLEVLQKVEQMTLT